MEIQHQTKLYVLGSLVLAFMLGVLVVYVLMTMYSPAPVVQLVSEDPAPGASAADSAVVAPENYAPVQLTHLNIVPLPPPQITGTMAVESALQERRSRREFAETPLTLAELGQMLWAGQGMTNDQGGRTAPSSRNKYPLRLFVAVDRVTDVPQGIYEYLPETHSLGQVTAGSLAGEWEAISAQVHPQVAAAVIFVSAVITDPTTAQPTLQESGHVGQNFYLQAEALDLNMTVMGGFDSEPAQSVIGIDAFEKVLYLVPFGQRPTVAPAAES